jgi:hypothetical protein
MEFKKQPPARAGISVTHHWTREILVFSLAKRKAAGNLITATFVDFLAHTGQSSQLFADANNRNAKFLATATRSV